MSRIKNTFKRLKKEGGKAFIPYIMAGDPSLPKTEQLAVLLAECGADVLELGVPFSDPLADGPVIQRASERALSNGVTLRDVISLAGRLRTLIDIPIVLMTYYNPVFKYGEMSFVEDAVSAGVDGVIVPDLPPEEAEGLIIQARINSLDTIFLVAPTSTEKRKKIVSKASSGFIYYVSLTGITGSRINLAEGLRDEIESVRRINGKPVSLGFGVSTPEEAAQAARFSDGVIVGSAIVKRAGGDDGALRDYIKSLRAAIA